MAKDNKNPKAFLPKKPNKNPGVLKSGYELYGNRKPKRPLTAEYNFKKNPNCLSVVGPNSTDIVKRIMNELVLGKYDFPLPVYTNTHVYITNQIVCRAPQLKLFEDSRSVHTFYGIAYNEELTCRNYANALMGSQLYQIWHDRAEAWALAKNVMNDIINNFTDVYHGFRDLQIYLGSRFGGYDGLFNYKV